ncbi:MAG: hypothetical protein ABJL72_04290 [Roseobacter sp.]
MTVWYKTSGDIITSAGRAPVLPENATEAPATMTPKKLLTMMLTPEGNMSERPVSPAVVSSGSVHTIEDCPIGTIITVFDEIGEEVMGEITTTLLEQTETIELPDTGEYLIHIQAPLPALPTERRIFQ